MFLKRLLQLFSEVDQNKPEKIVRNKASNANQESNKIFLWLESHSLIYALRSRLNSLNIDDLIKEIQKRKPKLSEKLSIHHENNYYIILIYSILTEILDLIVLRISQKKLTNNVYEVTKKNYN